jgi:shikimate dehydrogenase
MQEAALRALGLEDWSYQRLPVPPELFAETVRALPGSGFAGANVTIPHKAAALELATRASDAAGAIGAANTLTFAEGEILADNTDAPGLLAALPESPTGAFALVLGAGGAARAAVWALREAGARVTVWSRRPERAAELARALGADVAGGTGGRAFGVVVNCTPVGLSPGDDALAQLPLSIELLAGASVVVDLAYSNHETTLIAAARAAGTQAVVDGLEVLVRQGALSFERWTDHAAPLEVMRAAARSSPIP